MQEHAALEYAAAPEGADDTEFGIDSTGFFGLSPFKIPCGNQTIKQGGFALSAPSTKKNAARIMRAMQLNKPILLEGSPGVGKTSIISALAAASGHKLVRLNLSEQTDMMDLLGADLPAAGGGAGEFVWSDGAFLAALKAGDWVLLDELNLAPQPVLEGLNAVLDHRAEVFVPELGQTFRCPPTFRVFAAQNPVQEGGGRKGLPKSFLNRFTRVHVEPMCAEDLNHISRALHPGIPAESVSSMVRFNATLANAASTPGGSFARAGSPWEFNLRDILRWCDLAERSTTLPSDVAVERLFGTLFVQRLRNNEDRDQCVNFFEDAFGYKPPVVPQRQVFIEEDMLCVGDARIKCGETKIAEWGDADLGLIPGQFAVVETIAHCIQRGWMSILVGGASSGKTTIVQLLASLSGNRLRQAALTAATDTSELLGSFEQRDPSRDRADIEDSLLSALKDASSKKTTWSNIDRVENAWRSWETYKSTMKTSVDMTGSDSFNSLVAVVKALGDIDDGSRSVDLMKRIEALGRSAWAPGPSPDAGRFEWVDGVLLNAVINGEWVLLENANLCSPTVLDRLNPLLEPEGFLLVNECGLIDGQPRIINAHPNFRLFLAIDPKHGEVSRAMRNRGVEVFLLPSGTEDGPSKDVGLPQPLYAPPASVSMADDLTKILESIGVPGGFIQGMMVRAHTTLGTFLSKPGMKDISSRDISEWSALTLELLARGHDAYVALATSWSQVYMRGESNAEIRDAASAAFKSACVSSFSSLLAISKGGHGEEDDALAHSVLFQPMNWPFSSIMHEMLVYNAHSVESRDRAQTALFEGIVLYCAGQVVSGDAVYALSPVVATALPVAVNMHRIGYENAAVSRRDPPERVIAALRATSMLMLDTAVRVQDEKTFKGLVLRLTAFNRVSGITSVAFVSDELSALLCALQMLEEYPITRSMLAVDFSWRSMVVRGVLHKARVELHAQCAADVSASPKASCMQLSVWRSHDQVARKRAAPVHPCVDVLSVLLGSCAQFEESLLQQMCDSKGSSQDLASVREFQDWRLRLEHFSMTSRSDLFKVDPTSGLIASPDAIETIAVVWLKLREALSPLLQRGETSSLDLCVQQVNQASKLMDDALEIPKGKPVDPLLWKHAGRPSLPRTTKLLDMELSVREICHALQVRASFAADVQQMISRRNFGGETTLDQSIVSAACAALGAGVGLRAAALEGLCFFAWTHINPDKEMSTSEGDIELEANEIPRLLGIKCDDRARASGVDTTASIEEEENQLQQNRHISDLPAQELFKSLDKEDPWRVGVTGDVFIPSYPPMGFPAWSLKWESIVRLHSTLNPISELWSISSQLKLLSVLTAQLVCNEVDDSNIERIVDLEGAKLIAQNLAFGIAVSPRSPADFVGHRHLLWLCADSSNSSSFDKLSGLRENLHDMWMRWHAAQWNNSIDAVPTSLLSRGKKDDEYENPILSKWTTASGAARLERASATTHAAAIVADANIGCAERLPRMVQLRAASRLLRFEQDDAIKSSRDDWLALSSLTSQVLLSHQVLLTEVNRHEERDALVGAIGAFSGSVVNAQAAEATRALTQLKDACAPLFELYVPLEEMRESVVFPLLECICSGSTSKDVMKTATLAGDAGARDRTRRGKAWGLIGLLRLNLLLPNGLSDPAVIVRTELWHLQTTMEHEIEPMIGVQRWCQRMPSAPSVEDDALAFYESCHRTLSEKGDKLRALALPRPIPSRWAALRREVLQFRQGLGASQRLLDLLDRCSAVDVDDSIIMEAETWLGSSAQWSARLGEEYKAYRDMTQPLQLAIYELRRGLSLAADAAKARTKRKSELVAAAAALFSFPTIVNSAFDGSVALMLSEDRVLKALSSAENAAAAHLPFNTKSGELEISALRVALTSALTEARREGALSVKSWERLSRCFHTFSALYESCREEDIEAERLATEVFKQATKGPTSFEANEGNDEETEERAYRIAFKDFASDYSDFKELPDGPLMLEHDCVEETDTKEDDAEDETNITRAARVAGILEGELAEELVNIHYAALTTLQGAPIHAGGDSTVEQERIVRTTRLEKYGKYVRNLSHEEAQRASEFARAYDTGIAVLKASQLELPSTVDYASRLGHSLRIALEHSAVSKPALSIDAMGTSPYSSQTTPEEEQAMQEVKKRSKAELDEDAAADALDTELTVGGCPGEMALIVPPVAAARRRLTVLLEEWPDHPLLTQLAAICDRMLALPLLGPVKAGLTGIELLLARAQIWEESAASHTSHKAELNELAKLALRWRARELRTWPRLLARCSERHASRAKRTWFALHRLLNSMKSDSLLSGEEDVKDVEDAADLEKLRSLTVALEEYLQACTLGEFHTRLELVWCFYAEIDVEIRAAKARGARVMKQDAALCAIMYNVWRYYAQFEDVIDKHIDSIRKPSEIKLRDHAKLAKWEDRGYHAMKVQGEANQRSLHKFVRAFDTALNGLVLPILEAAAAQTGFKDLSADIPLQHDGAKLSRDELAAVHQAKQAEIDTMREAELAELKSQRDQWMTMSSEANKLTVSGMESSARVSQSVAPEFRVAAMSQDEASYQSRLPALVKRMGKILGEALNGEEEHDVRTAGAESLDDFAVTIAQRSQSLREDKAAKKAIKRKALQDLLKALPAMGIKHSRAAVPVEYRVATSWFAEEAMQAPRCLDAIGVDSAIAFADADKYYFRSMARIQRLWLMRTAHNPDLTGREVEISILSCEHLLHIMRMQRRTIIAAAAAEADIDAAYKCLSVLKADAELPSQRFTESWLVEQNALIERFGAACLDASLINRAVSAAETIDAVKPMTPGVQKALIQCKELVSRAKQRLGAFLACTLRDTDLRVGHGDVSTEAWRSNVIASGAALDAIKANFADFKSMSATLDRVYAESEKRLSTGEVGMHGANALPGWAFMQSIIDADATAMEKDFASGVLPTGERVAGDVGVAQTRLVNIRDNIESLIQSTLIWVQDVDKASKPIMVKREFVTEGQEEEEEAEGTMLTYEAAAGGALSTTRLARIVDSISGVIREVRSLTDEAHADEKRQVLPLVTARIAEITPLLGLLRSAVRRVLSDYVDFHKSTCKLESVLTALFLGLCAEGFCIPPEEAEGEAGGGMMDDQSGTGMGAGEGKKDVADEIENEDQIMGMEDLEKQEEETDRGQQEDDEGGIEMQNDFEGVIEDVEKLENEDQDDDAQEEEFEKEMGEDGEDGDVVDERMWNDEDDENDETNQGPEKYEEGSGVQNDDKQETETRAAEEEEDDDKAPKKDRGAEDDSGKDQGKDEPDNDQSTAPENDDDGRVNDEEIEENHGMNPSKPEQEELELDEEMNIDMDDVDGDDDESARDEDAEMLDEPQEDVGAEEQNAQAEGQMQDDGDGGITEDTMDIDEKDDDERNEDDELATDNLRDDAIAADSGEDDQGEQGGPQGQGSGGGGDQDNNNAQGQGGENGANARGTEGQGEDETKARDAAAAADVQESDAPDRQLPPPQSSTDIPSAGADGEGTGAGASGGEGMIAPMSGGAGGDQQKNQPPQKQQRQDANPHRSLGDALKSWKDRLNVVGDASEDKDNRADTGGADDGPMGNEYEFERNADESGDAGDDGDRGGIQTLADATEEQALQHSLKEQSDADERDADDVDLTQMQDDGNVTMPEEGDQKGGENDDDDEGREKTGKAAQHRKKDSSLTKKDVKPGDAAPVAGIDGEEVEDDAMDDDERVIGEGESGEESKIALQLENTSLKQMSEAMRELTADDIEQARVEAEQSLTKWREKSSNDKTNEANAQNLWRKLEQLTTALSAELAEKLRLILEPTLASRLQGDFKTGKRLNMRKIIPYIASDFRKDKIWLRRSRPSARKYQVMLAIDDSRSMAENHCGHIALESMVLLARAMARLEVGEIGVVGFGAGANAVRTLHPLGAPFTDQEGPSLVSKLSFAEDNTLADKPMVQLLETMSARLSVAREQIRGGGTKLQQLVLIIADGRFHEKEALRRCMREMGAQRGLLVAFIVLDNPKNSLLNMQSVSFQGGKPVMKKYLDSFPFPFYVLVQDVSQLPATISDLLRQWFEMAASD